MTRVLAALAVSVAVCLALTTGVWSQQPAATRQITIGPDGAVTVQNAVVPLPGMLSEGGRKVLMRTRPTEGPGAPVPVPGNIADMAELRRVYNENLSSVRLEVEQNQLVGGAGWFGLGAIGLQGA